jgi:hypothetical protein
MPGSWHQGRDVVVLALAAMIAAVVLLTGCTSSGSHHRHVLAHTDGLRICDDIKRWMATAEDQNKPRFTPLLERDEREAAGTALGVHLAHLDSNLRTENSDAFIPGTTHSTSFQDLQQECAGYGVKIPGVDI